MKLIGRFWIFVLLVCVVGVVNGWDIDGGVSRLRGVLAGILGSAFFVTAYISSRATSFRQVRMFVNGSAGLICGCLCAGLLGRGTVEVIVFGLVGVLLSVGSDVWLSGF
jgi:F0F1-type ATP synthase assembly protein I